MHKRERLVSSELPKFISPALVKKGKVSFRFNIHLQVSRVSETTLNAKVKANKLSLLYLIVHLDFPATGLPTCFLNFSNTSSLQHLVTRCSTQLMFVLCEDMLPFLFFVSVSSYYVLHLTIAHFFSFSLILFLAGNLTIVFYSINHDFVDCLII